MSLPDDEVFSHAIEFDSPAEQDRFIDRVCSGDIEQQRRLKTLLGTHRRMQDQGGVSVLERASDQLNRLSAGLEPQPGTTIDRYRLVEKLGEGGMGIVFSAEQFRPIQRIVALKLLRPGMHSQRILARFALEKQLLEQMDHPGITRVLDAGVQEDGCPFFVMDLVRNPIRITDYCDQKQLSVSDRIQLLIQVCRIVHYAHQRGVIHRDLKPSNILVSMDDEQPQPRIIDFGIAKALNATNPSSDSTGHGECLGTPAYMSSEQAMSTSGSPDVRSDIYSLGVVLYELLTGETPRAHSQLKTGDFAWKTPAFWKTAILAPSKRVAQSGESAATVAGKRGCSTDHLRQQLTRDLDSILLKALATDRDERYQNIFEFQRDLERLLAGYPVEAVGPSKLYRFRKLVWRHRWVSAATGFALFAIIASSVLATMFAFRANRAEQVASQRLNEALAYQEELQQKREEAESASKRAYALLRMFQVQAVSLTAITRYAEPILEALKSGSPVDPSLVVDQATAISSQVLTSPDPRLIVKGDWSWAAETIDCMVDGFNLPIEMSSRDTVAASRLNEGTQNLAELLEHNRKTTVPARLRFQMLVLEELRKKLPPQDPFVAEVLDNCGLLAIRLDEHEKAIEFLTESVAIWKRHETYRSNALQSQLFLAESMILHGRTDEARGLLAEVQAGLNNWSTTPEVDQLRGLLRELQLKTDG